MFVSLLHSCLSDSHYLTGSDQLKDWHAGVCQLDEGTAVVVFFIVCEHYAWYHLHDGPIVGLIPGDQGQMGRDMRYTSSSYHTWL